MSFLGGRRATEPRRPRRRKHVCLSLSGKSILPILNSWFASGRRQLAHCWASREGLCAHGAHGSTIRAKSAARSGRWPCCIQPSCCDNPRISNLRGRICERLQVRSKSCRVESARRRGRKRLAERGSRPSESAAAVGSMRLPAIENQASPDSSRATPSRLTCSLVVSAFREAAPPNARLLL